MVFEICASRGGAKVRAIAVERGGWLVHAQVPVRQLPVNFWSPSCDNPNPDTGLPLYVDYCCKHCSSRLTFTSTALNWNSSLKQYNRTRSPELLQLRMPGILELPCSRRFIKSHQQIIKQFQQPQVYETKYTLPGQRPNTKTTQPWKPMQCSCQHFRSQISDRRAIA